MRPSQKIVFGIIIILIGIVGYSVSLFGPTQVASINLPMQLTGEVMRVAEVDLPGSIFEEEILLSGDPLKKAGVAAEIYFGHGKVTDAEVGNEEGAYEIELTFNDRSKADVYLDQNYNILNVEYD